MPKATSPDPSEEMKIHRAVSDDGAEIAGAGHVSSHLTPEPVGDELLRFFEERLPEVYVAHQIRTEPIDQVEHYTKPPKKP